MGLFDFNKKEGNNNAGTFNPPEPAPPNLGVPPTDKIKKMRSQGLDNNQIIMALQREGYGSDIIFKAMNQADISAGIEQNPQEDAPDLPNDPAPFPSNIQNMQNPMQANNNAGIPYGGYGAQDSNRGQRPMSLPSGIPNPNNMNISNTNEMLIENMPPPNAGLNPSIRGQNMANAYGANQMPPPMQNMNAQSNERNEDFERMSIERIEEIAEAIIDEKWNEIVKSINKIIDWKDRTESKITKLEQRFLDMKKDFEILSQGVLGKVGEYDKNLSDLGVEIKAMERVFQKVLPSLTENVHTLDRITKDIKASNKDILKERDNSESD